MDEAQKALDTGVDIEEPGPLSRGQVARVLGVKIDLLTLDQVLVFIEQTILNGRRAIVANVNVHAANLAYSLPWFRAFLNQSDLVFCDGFGVMLGARLLGYKIPERFTPPDWIARLAALSVEHDFSLFFLGARPVVAEMAAERLRGQFPSLRIVGAHHGYFVRSPGHPENEAVVQLINRLKPNILIVGFGMPLQEQWLLENWDDLDVNVALPVGALFDYMSGVVRRGPRWMTDHGVEWLARLVIEPRRLWHRYLVGNPLFFWRVLRQMAQR